MPGEHYQHIFIRQKPEEHLFRTALQSIIKKRINPHERQSHIEDLTRKFDDAWREATNERVVYHSGRDGVYMEFISDPGAELVTKSLEEMKTRKVRLLNIRQRGEGDQARTYATVYVADDERKFFTAKFEAFATKDTRRGRPAHSDLINSIADIRKALLIDSFWQDDTDLLPNEEKVWCEVWLSSDASEVADKFKTTLLQNNIQTANGMVIFPERIVIAALVNRPELEQLSILSDDIAEYRRAHETAFFVDLQNKEQSEWVRDLQARIRFDAESPVAICIHDTGVNNGHPLLIPILPDSSRMTVDSRWGDSDHDGHGTKMAGIAAYGDLQSCILSREPVYLSHHLESVKILPPNRNENPQELWGYICSRAISQSEIEAPNRKRVHCLAVAASDTRDRGRPSSWSGALDRLTSGAEDDFRRLIIVCAGNANTLIPYPDVQLTDSVHDPAQAWNAVTVGAMTNLSDITEPEFAGYSVIAPTGGLSPYSTTSLTWEPKKWPVKPEIVFEGGNAADDGHGFCGSTESLSLLTTSHDLPNSHFSVFNATSAATAQAAWLAAKIQTAYPDMWPETVRALMIHSAEWTDQMETQFLGTRSKTEYAQLLKICGYGIPSLERAVTSAQNSVSMVIEQTIQPYDKKPRGGYRTKEMHLYELPWPVEVLQDLPFDTIVQMRVTLSYFIEPGPGEVGWKDRYRYASHALRFDIRSPGEGTELFLKRINKAARDEDEEKPDTSSAAKYWSIGSQGRDKGSVHSDIWTGTPQELADSGVIAVYPVIGWWRERAHLGRWGRSCRYSLIVTISTPEEGIDVYTPVAQQVGITVPVIIGI